MKSFRASVIVLLVCSVGPVSGQSFDARVDVGPTSSGTVTSRAVAGFSVAGFRAGVDGSLDTFYQPDSNVTIGASTILMSWVDGVKRVTPELSWTVDPVSWLSLTPWAGWLFERHDVAMKGTPLRPESVPAEMNGLYHLYDRDYAEDAHGFSAGIRGRFGDPGFAVEFSGEFQPALTSSITGVELGVMPVFQASAGAGYYNLYRTDWTRASAGFRAGGKAGLTIEVVPDSLSVGLTGGFFFRTLSGTQKDALKYWLLTGSSTTTPTSGASWYQDDNEQTAKTDTYEWEAGLSARIDALRRLFPDMVNVPTVSVSMVGWLSDFTARNVANDDTSRHRVNFDYVRFGLSFGL